MATNICDLPNETLLNILRYLDYWDLRLRIPLICKRFKALVGQRSRFGTVDKILFRDEARRRVSNDYLVHPVFDMLSYTWDPDSSYHAISFLRNPNYKFYNTPVATENAITPASSKVLLHFDINGHKINVDGSSSTGDAIPVIGVMGTIVMLLMGEMLPPGSDPDDPAKMKIGEIVGGFEWHGFERVEVRDGYVHLYINHTTESPEI